MKIKDRLKDPLYKNSLFIMANSVVSALFGFVFWMLAARSYSKDDVGVATALISASAFLILLTRFGLESSMVRFFPQGNRSRIFNTILYTSLAAAVGSGIIYVAGIDVFTPALALLKNPLYSVFFIVFLAASSALSTMACAFLAARKAEYALMQSLVIGTRILFLFPLVFLGSVGIFASFGFAYILALLVLVALLPRSGASVGADYDKSFLKKAFGFSAGNYVAGLLVSAPQQILPIMILNVLGPKETAFYYIAYSIAAILFVIPNAVGTSLFVEGSHGEAVKKSVLKSVKAIFVLLVPAVLAVYFLGGFVLSALGKDYSENGLELLKILVFASFFIAVFSIYSSIKRIQKDVKELVYVSGLLCVLMLSSSFFLMQRYGLAGIGYAWVASYGILALVIAVLAKRKGWA